MGTTLSQDIAITDHVVNVAITRDDPNPTLGPNVTFNVAFPEDVINVDAADFVVVTTGSAGGDALVTVNTATASTYEVTVSNVSRHGTLGLDIARGTDIQNSVGAPPAQTPTVDEVYDVINDAHGILSLVTRVPGNVTASVSGLNLAISGDSGDNGISISANATGDIIVTGVGGTTINGVAEFVAFPAAGGALPGNLTAQSSSGRDLISIADVIITGDVYVRGGDDLDAIDISHVNAGGRFLVFGDGGSGFIEVADSKISGYGFFVGATNGITITITDFLNVLAISGGAGVDSVTLGTVSVAAATQLSPGGGNNIVTLTDTQHLNTLYITPGDGNDTIVGSNVDVTQMLFINTLEGNDIVDFTDLYAMNSAVLFAGTDNDAVRLLNSVFDAYTTLPITAGNNVIDIQGSTFNGATYQRTTGGALGVRIKSNTFNSAVSLDGGPGATDSLLDNLTSSFSQAANLSDFENTSLTHIDAVFSNLLNLLFS